MKKKTKSILTKQPQNEVADWFGGRATILMNYFNFQLLIWDIPGQKKYHSKKKPTKIKKIQSSTKTKRNRWSKE